MKLKRFKFISSTMILMLVFIISLGVSAAAYESYNPEINGSITVHLRDIGTPKGKVEISLYKVGDIKVDSNLEFILKEEYKGSKVDLNSITSAKDEISTINKLEPYLERSSTYKNAVTDDNGIAVWNNLSQGAYLIAAKNSSEYGKISPSLIYVPYTDESGSKWVYDVKMYPKSERPDINPPKDENTDLTNPPDSSIDITTSGNTVKTGDNTNYTPYILIGIFAVIGIIIIMFLKPRVEKI